MQLFQSLMQQTTPAALARASRAARTSEDPLAYAAVLEHNAGIPATPFVTLCGLSLTLPLADALSSFILSAHSSGHFAAPSLRHLAHTLSRLLESSTEGPLQPSQVLSPSELCCTTDCGRSPAEVCRNV